jgi:hypothetical protein
MKAENPSRTWHTDSNGYLMEKRSIRHSQVAKNYYPMTSHTYIENPENGQRFSVVTDRAQGMTSPNIGEIEIMLYRWCLVDDRKGLVETLEPRPGELVQLVTTHYLLFSNPSIFEFGLLN